MPVTIGVEAQPLVADGELVVDVPAKLTARVRERSVGHGRKTDPDDAVSVAVAAQGASGLRRVGVEGHEVVLRLLTNRREDLVAMRTQTVNRLHRLLVDLVPTGAWRNLTANRAATLLSQVAPTGTAAITRCHLAQDLIADVRDLDQRIADIEARIKAAVTKSRTSLAELFGVGPSLAAKLLGEVGDIRRFPTKHHFATHTGTAPLEASSGQVVRHRLSRAGDRKLNHALYLMAIVQVRHPHPRAGLLPPQARRRQVAQGSAALPQTAPVGCRLRVPGRRSARTAAPGGRQRLITSGLVPLYSVLRRAGPSVS